LQFNRQERLYRIDLSLRVQERSPNLIRKKKKKKNVYIKENLPFIDKAMIFEG